MTVRAFFQAAKIEGFQPPYDTIHLKIFYPTQMSKRKAQRNRKFCQLI